MKNKNKDLNPTLVIDHIPLDQYMDHEGFYTLVNR